MDADLTFGASVWGDPVDSESISLPPPALLPAIASTSVAQNDSFDDFDTFGPPTNTISLEDADDEFGDFGDFGDADVAAAPVDFGEASFEEEVRIAGPSSGAHWEPLRLDPMPSKTDLRRQVDFILEAIWGNNDISAFTTNEDIREAEGVSQILTSPESRDLYSILFQAPPPTKPPNWTRSRIRRQHLIALGIPVNLDEVLPQTNGKPLPPLQITTRPMSAPPGPRNPPRSLHAIASNSRVGSPPTNGRSEQPQFGPKPELDEAKIADLLSLDLNNLPLLPVAALEKHLADMRKQTENTSALLTHLLQVRESLHQDAETYNGLIAELVGEAQKQKSNKVRAPVKRGSLA